MADPVAVANVPITNDPDTFGTEVYSLAVNGGTLYIAYTRQPSGQNPTSAVAFVPSGVSLNQFPTALATVGAGTLLAAALLGGLIVRTGPVAAFTDTTDTAALIQAAWSGGAVGSSFEFSYRNTTQYNATLAGGVGVTLSGPVIVPANSAARFLAVWTGANTITITNASSTVASLPNAVLTALNATVGALAAGKITGGKSVTMISSNAVPGAQTVRTAAQMLADTPNAGAGFTWNLRIVNTGAGTLTLTADGGATVTLAGTMTVAQNTYRDFVCSLDSATTATITDVGKGTYD